MMPQAHIEADRRFDRTHGGLPPSTNARAAGVASAKCALTGPLTDSIGRTQNSWRLSITDRCNLRCTYCTPSGKFKHVPARELLTLEELLTLSNTLRNLGVRKIKITGGEPLKRPDLCDLVRELTSMRGIEDVGVTTNGILLPQMAKDLARAGLRRINMSLDTLNAETYRQVTRRGDLRDAMAGMLAAINAGLSPVKLNTVLLKGVNEPDVLALTKLSFDLPIHVRFCEQVPCDSQGNQSPDDRFTARQAMAMIQQAFGDLEPVKSEALAGPARLYRLPGSVGAVGFIDPVSGHSCGTCNRMRLTPRGTLRPCLFNPTEIDIKTALKRGAGHDELTSLIRQAVHAKPRSAASQAKSLERDMNLIGG